MDIFEIVAIFLLIGYLIALFLILISDGDLSLMFWDKFGRKLGKCTSVTCSFILQSAAITDSQCVTITIFSGFVDAC